MRYLDCLSLICLVLNLLFIPLGNAEVPEYPADNYSLIDPFKSQLPAPKPEPPPEKIKSEQAMREVVLPPFTVQGMVWQSPSPLAIIDNKVVKVGDTINDAKVVGVSKEGIDLLYQGKVFTISPVPVLTTEPARLTSESRGD